MKAKYFKKIRSQVKWYKVSYRDSLFFSFSDEKEILAKSPENACVRYHNVLDVLLTNIIPIILHNIVNLFQGSRYV